MVDLEEGAKASAMLLQPPPVTVLLLQPPPVAVLLLQTPPDLRSVILLQIWMVHEIQAHLRQMLPVEKFLAKHKIGPHAHKIAHLHDLDLECEAVPSRASGRSHILGQEVLGKGCSAKDFCQEMLESQVLGQEVLGKGLLQWVAADDSSSKYHLMKKGWPWKR